MPVHRGLRAKQRPRPIEVQRLDPDGSQEWLHHITPEVEGYLATLIREYPVDAELEDTEPRWDQNWVDKTTSLVTQLNHLKNWANQVAVVVIGDGDDDATLVEGGQKRRIWIARTMHSPAEAHLHPTPKAFNVPFSHYSPAHQWSTEGKPWKDDRQNTAIGGVSALCQPSRGWSKVETG